MHHRLAVGADLDVALDAVAGGDGGANAPTACSRSCRRRVMQAAMGDRSGGQPVGRGIAQATSNRPSTSTAASSGSAATPTVGRAWRPLSPNTATIRSEAPFMTLGPSAKSGRAN